MGYYELMRSSLPEGESGNCKIERYTVSEAESNFSRMRSAFSSSRLGRYVMAGTYTRLVVDGGVMMSDTHDEIRDHLDPVRFARGTCFVTGLGLGCVVQGMLDKEDEKYSVDRVIVIEKNEHVISLVAPHFKDRYGERFEVRNEDALTYKPPRGERYDIVWHDIWADICVDNLKTMGLLHRKYGRRCDWQGSWQRDTLKSLQRREYKRGRFCG